MGDMIPTRITYYMTYVLDTDIPIFNQLSFRYFKLNVITYDS